MPESSNGNLTWIVRRLGGLDGREALMRGMITECDRIFDEARQELDRAAGCAGDMGMTAMTDWVAARKAEMAKMSTMLYRSLLENLA